MRPHYALEGKTVLITGAAGGIGAGLARAFAAQGVRLILLDRSVEALQVLADQLGADAVPSASIHTAFCDLGDDAQVAAFAQDFQKRYGTLDVLLNNAGVEYPTPLDSDAPDAMARWSALLDNNVGSMVRLTRAVLPCMGQGSSIINQSSIWGRTGVAGFSAYVASKHAVIGLTRALAFELAPRGIRVNAVCPGWIRTDAAMRSLTAMALAQGRTEAAVEKDLLALQALPTMLTPDDIAGVYLFLASSDAAPLTGQSLVASNGEVMA
ncbi:NAD(P)-dependent oxidoreductase [Rhodoferax lacus]|uniref:NAD(P)-dependent oxidoreductase n=1 Tax=Rhodoferax lacus TaxID=2184758 RepID=A0A3E1RDQ9_9BURK|nr:SDR family oxidoreductase [Rhodoferax lacus]RFO97499.1 NAD(P)-dependent oxidoreductase [Rhodoferax lacus]